MHHEEIFYQTAEFWVGIAFLSVVVLLFKPIKKLIKVMLNNKINTIKNQLEEAAKLKADAQNLLKEYKSKAQNASLETKYIMSKSKREIEFFRKESLKKLELEMENKSLEAERQINAAKQKAISEISALAGNLSIGAVKRATLKRLDSKAHDKLINDSIKLLESMGDLK